MLEGARDNLSEEPTIDTNKLPGFSRTDVLFTEQELFNFVSDFSHRSIKKNNFKLEYYHMIHCKATYMHFLLKTNKIECK